jgi:CheY-like chemotaxis protein
LSILLVDDNAVNLLVGRRILGMFGYDTVETAADGQQAVEMAERTRYDLVLMDL